MNMSPSKTTLFYDDYHKKNDRFNKVISRNNFTYFYILELLHKPYVLRKLHGRVLDVGCGVGTLVLYSSKWAKYVVGLDVSERAIAISEEARRHLQLKSVRFVRSEISSYIGAFDCILCTEVIEHVPDDETFLETLHSNLADQGLLVLTTPSSESLLYKLGFYKSFDAEVGHLRRYTEASLTELLKAKGFRIVFLRSVESPLRNVLFTTRLGFIIRFIKGPLIPVFHWFDRTIARILGATDIQVIAQKVT